MANWKIFNDPKRTNYSWIGILITLLFIIAAIYVLVKFRKTPGYWWGILTMILLFSYLTINKDGTSFSIGGILSASPGVNTNSQTQNT